MKTKVFGAAVFAALAAGVVVAFRRFGPELTERGMNKCHEMMGHLGEEVSAQAGGAGGRSRRQ